MLIPSFQFVIVLGIASSRHLRFKSSAVSFLVPPKALWLAEIDVTVEGAVRLVDVENPPKKKKVSLCFNGGIYVFIYYVYHYFLIDI